MKHRYNLEHLVTVKVYDFTESVWYYYLKEVKILGFTWKKEGFYDSIWNIYKGKAS